jgi:hypothetical protein
MPDFIKAIRQTLAHEQIQLAPPSFIFDVSPESAEANYNILKAHNFDLEACLNLQPPKICNPGSEFKPILPLRKVFKNHPLWSFIKTTIRHGAPIHLHGQPVDKQCLMENVAMIEYNNHKKA